MVVAAQCITFDACAGTAVQLSSTFQSPYDSCRNPQDSAGLQAKAMILVAIPPKLC